MGLFTPRLTRQRLLGAAAMLLVALLIAYLAGVDISAFGLGIAIGVLGLGAIVAVSVLLSRRPRHPPEH